MKFELFFTKKIINRDKKSFSSPIIKISVLAIALGISLMTISLCIVNGFQDEIKKKISGFGAHLTVSNYSVSGFLDENPISKERKCFNEIRSLEGIDHVQGVVYKSAIIKNDNSNYGIVIKGVDKYFNWDFFNKYLEEGTYFNTNTEKAHNEVIISRMIADKLNLELSDNILIYFVQNPARFRKLKIKGIYSTGLGELDEQFILTDMRHIQKVNGWTYDKVNGIEIYLNNFNDIEQKEIDVNSIIDYDLGAVSIKKSRADVFNWLELQDINVIVIIGLLLLVSGINIISTLLILIIEKTNTIGILKAIGANNSSISRIFILNAAYLIIFGLIIGNALGLGLSFVQLKYGLIKLPQEAYFIDKVPILIKPIELMILNLGTLLFCLLVLLIPARIVSRIDPIKSIRFD